MTRKEGDVKGPTRSLAGTSASRALRPPSNVYLPDSHVLLHYDRRRILRVSVIVWAAILLAVLLSWLAGSWAPTAGWLWSLVVFLGLLVHAVVFADKILDGARPLICRSSNPPSSSS